MEAQAPAAPTVCPAPQLPPLAPAEIDQARDQAEGMLRLRRNCQAPDRLKYDCCGGPNQQNTVTYGMISSFVSFELILQGTNECLIKLCVSEQPLHITLKSKNCDHNRGNKQVAHLRIFYIESYDYGYHTPFEKFNCTR